jgi:deoxycytidine triphosphate deaminase
VRVLLNREQIETDGIVIDPKTANFRSASYDVSVGSVIGPDGRSADSLLLPSQQMVMVISAERLLLPNNVAGYAMPKTRLSNKGVLALSTGIIDPGYEGRVSSILINFGKDPFFLDQGEAFLRVTFHRTAQLRSGSFVEPPGYSEDSYQRDRRDIAVTLPETFLNIPQIESTVATRVSLPLSALS